MRTFALLAALALLAGCASHEPIASPVQEPLAGGAVDPAAASPPSGPAAGTAQGHGTPHREASAVTVKLEGTGWVARQTVTVTNDFGGAAVAHAGFATTNGDVGVAAGKGGGYRLRAELRATAGSEQEARDLLATMVVHNEDSLADGRLELGLKVEFKPDNAPAPLLQLGNRQRGADVAAELPPEPAIGVAAGTTNGGVTVAGLHGDRLELHTTNGGVSAQGAWEEAAMGATNGGLTLKGTFNRLDLGTANGDIEAEVASTASGSQSAQTTNGGIGWTVARASSVGVRVDASTTNGEVSASLPGYDCEGKSCEGATPGADRLPVVVSLTLQTTNGDIDLAGK